MNQIGDSLKTEEEVEQPPFTIRLNERGEVMLIRHAASINLGPSEGACEEMCRFLTETGFADCAPTNHADEASAPDDQAAKPIMEIDEANFRLDPTLSSGL